jgi:hypothetical protein
MLVTSQAEKSVESRWYAQRTRQTRHLELHKQADLYELK